MIKELAGSKIFNREGDALCWVVRCDHCGAESRKPGADPGEGAHLARREGFRPIKNTKDPTGPMVWVCAHCATSVVNAG